MISPLIETEELTKEFRSPSGDRDAGLVAVDHVNLSINQGEVFGIVGESGSGKSTLARCIFGIIPATRGVVRLFGETMESKSKKEQRKIRSSLGLVFQDPVASLNPRMKIRDVIGEPLGLHTKDKEYIEGRVLTLIDRVGLSESHLDRRAHELSGGQCQRVAIARALSTNPKAILLDEPTSSLDLSVQAQILNLLEDLRQEFGLTYFLISHNLDVIAHLSDRIAVMSAGKIVEMGPTRSVIDNPVHPFTKQLVNAHKSSITSVSSGMPDFNLEGWQESPLNRWAFQHVDEFLPTRIIQASAKPYVWPEKFDPSLDDLKIDCDVKTFTVPELLEDLYTDSLLVTKNSEIVFEKYFNGMGRDSRHLLQSVSKSVLGLLAGQLIGEGLIDPTEIIGHYLPEIKGSGYFDATVQDALDMTAAVTFSEKYDDHNSEIQKLDRVAGWRPRRVGDPDGIREFIKTIKKNGNHGRQFQYCSANTDLLAWVFSQVTGVEYADLLSTRIWQPIGASVDATITVDDRGHPLANGGISATTRDIALLGALMIDRGDLDRNRVVGLDWIRDTRAGTPESVASVDYIQSLHPGGCYRNQWWITRGEHAEFYAVGIYGQYLWVDPVSRTVIVKFSTLPVATSSEHSRKHMALFKALGNARN